ncbi:MAG: LON peptidase substrate-binding domain-containing protein, partial [Candidatus Kapaibacterium sp.]
MNVLGLFPLHIVLFPEASYPLHIFEERYKVLIGESMRGNNEFGINLVEAGKMFEVGCRVKVTRILKDYPNGEKDIIVTGTTRYQVVKVRPSEAPYITADTISYDDEVTETESSIVEEAIQLYNE